MKTYWESGGVAPLILNLATLPLEGAECSASCLSHSTPRRRVKEMVMAYFKVTPQHLPQKNTKNLIEVF
jgi:hypothetical protein